MRTGPGRLYVIPERLWRANTGKLGYTKKLTFVHLGLEAIQAQGREGKGSPKYFKRPLQAAQALCTGSSLTQFPSHGPSLTADIKTPGTQRKSPERHGGSHTHQQTGR